MKGFVPTPPNVVDLMVEKLFQRRPPTADARLLDPGCGRGAFIEGVVRWCAKHRRPTPVLVGIESNPEHVAAARHRLQGFARIDIRQSDFLTPGSGRFDYIIGNPPYVPITGLTETERNRYRSRFKTASGRFDLYLLFYEQALRQLNPGGRLVFITPEKFLYVDTAQPLRDILRSVRVEELHFADEQTFAGLVTYPLISTVTASRPVRRTRVIQRDGRKSVVDLSQLPSSWLPRIVGANSPSNSHSLADVCIRVSCGVATGADSVFVVRDAQLEPKLRAFAYPTVSGRQLVQGKPLRPLHSMLVPYGVDGKLLPEEQLGHLGSYLAGMGRQERLLARTCVAKKPWYAFHENPPLAELFRPKLLCKDIGATPFFVADPTGRLLPRHSVYYIVPIDPDSLDELGRYLNSDPARRWLQAHCQRAANGFLRLQSHVLKRLPVPATFVAATTPTTPTPARGGSARSA